MSRVETLFGFRPHTGVSGGEAYPQAWFWVLPVIALSWSLLRFLPGRLNDPKATMPRSLDWPLPNFILNVRFALNAPALFQTGYQKFKHVAYSITRSDERITILPGHLVEELANLPGSIASPQLALDHDLLGRYTGVNLIVDSHLHYRIVQRKITPRIPLLLGRMEDAVGEALPRALGTSHDWSETKLFEVLAPIAARVSADILVGPSFCDDPTWLDISCHYTEDVFTTAALLRVLPTWLRPLVFPLFPSYWRIQKNVSRGKQLLGPKIRELINKNDRGEWEPRDDSPDDANMLSWLCHSARGGVERNPDVIAQSLMLLSLASVHTTLGRIVNVLYDITAAGPEIRDALVAEVEEAAATTPATATINTIQKSSGSHDAGSGLGSGTTAAMYSYDKLPRLDSVMHESQRLSPPVATGLKRVFLKPYTFESSSRSDDVTTTHIQEGTYVCVPVQAIEMDEENIVSPDKFDGLRNFRARNQTVRDGGGGGSSDQQQQQQFLFTTPTKTSLHFGYGRTACPGRFFAGYAIKVVLARVLRDYEFTFGEKRGGGAKRRPGNLTFHEFLFTSPGERILVRRKNKEEEEEEEE